MRDVGRARCSRYGLSGGRAGQQAGEDGERPVVGDHLFEPMMGDVQVGERSAEVGVASLVQTANAPASATAKLTPVMAMSAPRNLERR